MRKATIAARTAPSQRMCWGNSEKAFICLGGNMAGRERGRFKRKGTFEMLVFLQRSSFVLFAMPFLRGLWLLLGA